jgi:hypothetical protein
MVSPGIKEEGSHYQRRGGRRRGRGDILRAGDCPEGREGFSTGDKGGGAWAGAEKLRHIAEVETVREARGGSGPHLASFVNNLTSCQRKVCWHV